MQSASEDTDGLPRNGLSTAAVSYGTLSACGTQQILQALRYNPLNTATLSDAAYRSSISSDENLEALLGEIVSCALDRYSSVRPGVVRSGSEVIWHGDLGYCGASSPLGNWAITPPSTDCLEIVSSCVLARVNALGKEVVISMHGEPSGLFPSHPFVRVVKTYREAPQDEIPSVVRCLDGGPSGDPLRNCGWQGRYVGTCTKDSMVEIAPDPGIMVRVCNGIHACQNEFTPNQPWYAKGINSFSAGPSSMYFWCPPNPFDPSVPSSFAVMVAAPDPSATLTGYEDVRVTSGGRYRSPESEVFPFREGAFYGNIFKSLPCGAAGDPQKVLFEEQYTCFSDIWSNYFAHLADRLCAGASNPYCFANPPHPCPLKPFRMTATALDHSCNTESYGEQPHYIDCFYSPLGTRIWRHPITVYVNAPCDLALDQQSCMRAFPFSVQ